MLKGILLGASILVTHFALAQPCPFTEPAVAGIELSSNPGGNTRFYLKSPIPRPPLAPVYADFCWLTDQDIQSGATCQNATVANTAPPDVAIGYCEAGNTTFQTFPTKATLVQKEVLVLEFSPRAAAENERYLRFEWGSSMASITASRLFRVKTRAGVADLAADPRFKIWLYAGNAFLFSRKDFSDSFAEVRLHSEARWADALVSFKKREPAKYEELISTGRIASDTRRWWARGYTTFRGYGETGFTATTAATSTTSSTDALAGRRAADLYSGIGFGKTWIVTVDGSPQNTSAFSVLLTARSGWISIPGQDATATTPETPNALRFKSAFGFRVENENGHFRGAYFELGWGQSNQFEFQKNKRVKFDGFLPFNQPGFIRYAARLQMDVPRPSANLNPDFEIISTDPTKAITKEQSHELIRRGDIKVTLLANIDLQELTRRIGKQ